MNKKHWIIILLVSLVVIVPTVAFGLERVGDFYKPKPDEYYKTDNRLITLEDLVYTGSHVGVIRGAKTGTIPMGSTPLLRSAKNSSLGYAFYKPSELRNLATSLNGNPEYVVSKGTKTDIYKTQDGSGRETWVWARDLGRATGATVDIEETGEKDESGLPRLRVIFNTSKYPMAAFTNNEGKTPSKVKAGERFYAFVAAEEYDPYQEKISWELTMNGKVLDGASGTANRSVRNVPIIVNEPGTYTLILTVADGIERKTVLNQTITATKDAPPPGPDPEPEPEPEPENLPPIVKINGPTTVMAGEEFCLRADASDPDGTIEDYQWDYTGNGALIGSVSCFLWYEYEGDTTSSKRVEVVVTDNDGATASAEHYIKVLPPKPTAAFEVSGTLKENREVIITNKSTSPAKYPIKHEVMIINGVDNQESVIIFEPKYKQPYKSVEVQVIFDLNKNGVVDDADGGFVYDSNEYGFDNHYQGKSQDGKNVVFMYTLGNSDFVEFFKETNTKIDLDMKSFFILTADAKYKLIDARSEIYDGDKLYMGMVLQEE